MPTANCQLTVNLSAIANHQVNIFVTDPDGVPLSNCKVTVYRAVNIPPFATFVMSTYTDSTGFAYFDGLWSWFYALEAEDLTRDLVAPPTMFTVPLTPQSFTFHLKATPPPHTYNVRINFGLNAIAGAVGWLGNNVPQLAEVIVGAGGEYVKYWTESGWLVIQFQILHSPGWILVVGAIMAILIVLAILGWEIVEVVSALPPGTLKNVSYALLAIGIAAAVVAGGYAVSKIKTKK